MGIQSAHALVGDYWLFNYVWYPIINHFFRIELAADLVTLATAPSVADLNVDRSFYVSVFPPKTKARTIITNIRVRGKAITGEENQSKTSSIAAIPSKARAQVGIEAEYVYFYIKNILRSFSKLPLALCPFLPQVSSSAIFALRFQGFHYHPLLTEKGSYFGVFGWWPQRIADFLWFPVWIRKRLRLDWCISFSFIPK